MPKPGHILIIDDNEDILTAAHLLLKQHGYTVMTESSPDCIPAVLHDKNIDVILLDMNFERDVTSGREGMHWLREIKSASRDTVVILMTAYGDVELAVDAMRAGAFDFILKPWQNEKVLASLSAAMQLRRSRQETTRLQAQQKQLIADQDKPYHDMIGVSLRMQEVFRTIEKVAGTDANVLIMGENGTGKELVARALHRQSGRAGSVFISVDMGAVPETLFESEFFGHIKGAFTDAKQDKPGRFEVASGGTLFLDEIGNLSFSSQGKLLRALEERHITPVGSGQSRAIDIRLICATNMPLYEMISENTFRQDFLYRINTVEIHLPPLRERVEDIPLLADHFLALYARKYNKSFPSLHEEAKKTLQQYPWPGNVRELRHALERAVIMTDANTLDMDSFWFLAAAPESAGAVRGARLEDIEKGTVQKILGKHRWNISKAAGELGITRTALYRRIEKYGLKNE